MSEPLVVLLFVLASGEASPATPSIITSARQGLGPGARLLVEEMAVLPPDDEALRLAMQVHASAVVELDLASTNGPPGARLHVHLDARPGWSDRVVEFTSQESAAEYGRTLGFAVASMVTSLTTSPETSPSETTSNLARPASVPAPTASLQPPQPVGLPPETQSVAARRPPALPTPNAATSPAPRTPIAAPSGHNGASAPPFAVEADVIGTAIGAASSGLGGAVSGQATVRTWLRIQVDALLRSGDVSAAGATYKSWQLGGGTAWRMLAAADHPFEIDLRGDVYVCDLVVSRAEETHWQWRVDGTLALEGAWFVLTRNVGVVASAGIDTSFGTTRIKVGNDTVAQISPFRGLAALGVRVRF